MITQGKAKEILSEFEEIDALLQKHDGTPIFAHMQAFSYEKKLKIWDENECRYLAYHIDGTKPDDVIIGILGSSFMMGLKANWTLLNIMPRNSDNFSSFRYWAMDKTPYEPSCIVENEYWEEVGKRPFPERYLTDLIESIESLKKNHYESAAHVEQSRILNPIEMESFKSFCFCVGYDSFCDAREIDWSRLEEKLGYCFCATSIYHFGKCFWATLDAERVATLERFLITQKKRLDKGEDITKPATPPPASTEAALVPPPIEDKPQKRSAKTIQAQKNYVEYTNMYIKLCKSVNPCYSRERAIRKTIDEYAISERTLGRAFDDNSETLQKYGHKKETFKVFSRVKWS